MACHPVNWYENQGKNNKRYGKLYYIISSETFDIFLAIDFDFI